jgi:hypothetical protein
MLDPKEQAKGGFGAQIAREDERRQNLERAVRTDHAAADHAAPVPTAAQADGAAVVGPPTQGQPAPASADTARPVTRWR